MDEYSAATQDNVSVNDSITSPNRWALGEELVGPVIATFVGIELVSSLLANLFICGHTVLNAKKMLMKSSTLLLFNLALSNLLMAVLYMPFVVVASAAEEWIIGSTDEVRNGFCQFTGFIFAYTTNISVYTLAAISLDRFLSIVKPLWHKKFMTWKTALAIVLVIWTYSGLLTSIPYMGPDLGEYDWSPFTGSCLPLWRGNTIYVISTLTLATVPITILTVTSIWTIVFTRGFLKKDFRRQRGTLSKPDLKVQRDIYSERIRNLFGIFSALLFFYALSWSPFFIASFVGLLIGLENLPPQVFVTVFVLFLANNVTTPIIQSYFRKELLDSIKSIWRRVMCFNTRKPRDEEAQLPGSHDNRIVDVSRSMSVRSRRGTESTELCLSSSEHLAPCREKCAESACRCAESAVECAKSAPKTVEIVLVESERENVTDEDHVTQSEDRVTQHEDRVTQHEDHVTQHEDRVIM